MNWQDEIRKELTELMFAYYEHGANMHAIVPDADAKPIIDKVSQLLKEQREICAEEFNKLFMLRTNVPKDYPEHILNAPEPNKEGV